VKVAITHRGLGAALAAWVDSPWPDREWACDFLDLYAHHRTSIVWVDAYAPAVLWRRTRDVLAAGLYERRSFPSPPDKVTARKALQRIARAVALREHHPALRQMLAVGEQNEIIPAWWTGDRWSPYPDGSIFKLFTPTTSTMKGRVSGLVTRWSPQDPTLWTPSPHRLDTVFVEELLHVEAAYPYPSPFKSLVG
jgi:hypothetical protein